MLPLYALTPFTLMDFPGRPAAVVWCAGCNMRCAYCHNPDIVRGRARVTQEEALAFLESRRGKLEGVVLSGGEATIWPGLPEFVARVRILGFAVKLDTNGTRPDMLQSLLPALDYVALDYKAPRAKYRTTTGHKDFAAFRRSLDMLCGSRTPFEVRTTVHGALLDEGDIARIIGDLEDAGYRGTYYLQPFRRGDGPIMRDLPDARLLDRSAIPAPTGFAVEWR